MDKLRKLMAESIANYYMCQLKKDQWKDLRYLKVIQFKKLKTVLKHAYYYIPYYHKLFKSVNIRPNDIRNLDDVKKIPLLSKNAVQQNFADMVVNGVDVSRLPFGVTSGSTGIPLKIYRDFSFRNFGYYNAVARYIYSECGVRPDDNFVTVWGRDSKSIRWGKKYVRLWGGVSETVVPLFTPARLIRILRLIKPDVLSIFPSVLITLVNYGFFGVSPRVVFTGGEVVTEHCRELCRKTFGLEPFEVYGCVEFGNLAFECNEHCGLHMITNTAFVEFVDDAGESVSPTEQGEIVITSFSNYVMPLIRYRIGDIGIPTDEKCSCGRSWPLIKNIQGRTDDYLVLPNGRKFSHFYIKRAVFHKILRYNIFAFSQYQIIQDRKDHIILKIVKGREFAPKILEQVKKSLKEEFSKLDAHVEITIEVVDKIPMGRTGKRKLFISKIIQ
ncbi:MAG: hypothetical protein NWF09_01440 [Candidatus Bathyarchaeota archaeon]|nr:hypothetical protein [Candidatus Bathyarchaeota archaeon]